MSDVLVEFLVLILPVAAFAVCLIFLIFLTALFVHIRFSREEMTALIRGSLCCHICGDLCDVRSLFYRSKFLVESNCWESNDGLFV